MTTPSSRMLDLSGYQVPPLSYRILAGSVRLVALLVLLVGLPDAVLAYLSSHGVTPPVPLLTVTVAGAVISGLVTARYILRPTRAFGPVSAASSFATIGYLLTIGLGAVYRLALPSRSIELTLGYGSLVELALLVPGLALVAGVLTTLEDLRSPGERLPFDFPP